MSEEPKPNSKPGLRRNRFRLWHLFVLMTVAALVCWSVVRVRQTRQQREANSIIWQMGGWTSTESGQFHTPTSTIAWIESTRSRDWITELLGRPPTIAVFFGSDSELSNDDIEELIATLQRMPQLRAVFLEQAGISDEAVKKLRQALPNCQISVDVPRENEATS